MIGVNFVSRIWNEVADITGVERSLRLCCSDQVILISTAIIRNHFLPVEKFGNTLAVLCGIGFFFKDAARSIKERLLPALEQGFTDLKLETNLSGTFLASQDLQDCAGFLLGLE